MEFVLPRPKWNTKIGQWRLTGWHRGVVTEYSPWVTFNTYWSIKMRLCAGRSLLLGFPRYCPQCHVRPWPFYQPPPSFSGTKTGLMLPDKKTLSLQLLGLVCWVHWVRALQGKAEAGLGLRWAGWTPASPCPSPAWLWDPGKPPTIPGPQFPRLQNKNITTCSV